VMDKSRAESGETERKLSDSPDRKDRLYDL